MSTLDKIIGIVGTVSSISAAAFWLRSATIEVPDNIDTIVHELQRIGWWNSAAAQATVLASLCVASLCVAWLFVKQLWA
jgi:hypothetical protein